jgi:hypothetical protein
MWEPRRLATLWATTACNRDSFTFIFSFFFCTRDMFNLEHDQISQNLISYATGVCQIKLFIISTLSTGAGVLIFFYSHNGGGGWSPNWVHSARRSLLASCTCPGWRIWCNEDWQEKPKCSEKTCLSVTLSTTNPTWPDPGTNPGLRGEKPATNRLSYGAVRDRVVGITTGCGHDSRGLEVRVPVGSNCFSLPCFPDRFWVSPSLLANGYRTLFSEGKAAFSVF